MLESTAEISEEINRLEGILNEEANAAEVQQEKVDGDAAQQKADGAPCKKDEAQRAAVLEQKAATGASSKAHTPEETQRAEERATSAAKRSVPEAMQAPEVEQPKGDARLEPKTCDLRAPSQDGKVEMPQQPGPGAGVGSLQNSVHGSHREPSGLGQGANGAPSANLRNVARDTNATPSHDRQAGPTAEAPKTPEPGLEAVPTAQKQNPEPEPEPVPQAGVKDSTADAARRAAQAAQDAAMAAVMALGDDNDTSSEED